MTEARRKKKEDEQRELEEMKPTPPSSGIQQEETPTVQTDLETRPDGDVVKKEVSADNMPDTVAEAAKDIVIEDAEVSPWDKPIDNYVTDGMVKDDESLRQGVNIPNGKENPAEGLKPISLPDLKAVSLKDKEEQTKASESQPASDADAKPEDGYPASLAEYRKKLMDQEAKDMQSISDLEKENETREKRAKWTKAFASIGDAVSGIANLVGTAHWGKNAGQSSMTEGIHKELKDARDRYTKNIDDIRRRLSSTREGILKSYKDELTAKQAQQRIDLQNKREDRMLVKDSLMADLKAQGLDMKESEFNEMMKYRWEDLQYKIDRLGVERALQEERINLQRQAEERKSKTAEDNAAKKADAEARERLRGKWQSIAAEAKKTMFGNKTASNMTAEERVLYNRINGAKSKSDIDTLINEFENDPRMKPYLDSLRGQSAPSEKPSEKPAEKKESFTLGYSKEETEKFSF